MLILHETKITKQEPKKYYKQPTIKLKHIKHNKINKQ